MVVFVDDLDRCKVDTIAKTFDAIRLIAHIEDVIVIVGIDERIAFKAMGEAYKDYADHEKGRTKEDVARDYLGKIIQVPVRLEKPSADGLESYIEDKLFPKESRAEQMETDTKSDVSNGQENDRSARSDTNEEPASDVQVESPLPEIRPSFEEPASDVQVESPLPEIRPSFEKPDQEAANEEAAERRAHMLETEDEVKAFVALNKIFQFNNPRQLLRLRNTYRLLKALYPNKKPVGDAEAEAIRFAEGEFKLLMMLFWLEFRLQESPESVRNWKKSLETPKSSETETVGGLFHTDFLPHINFRKPLFPFKDTTLRALEGFTLTCLLPYPDKEIPSVAKTSKQVATGEQA